MGLQMRLMLRAVDFEVTSSQRQFQSRICVPRTERAAQEGARDSTRRGTWKVSRNITVKQTVTYSHQCNSWNEPHRDWTLQTILDKHMARDYLINNSTPRTQSSRKAFVFILQPGQEHNQEVSTCAHSADTLKMMDQLVKLTYGSEITVLRFAECSSVLREITAE